MVIRLEADVDAFTTVARALGQEADGKRLKRGMATEIRKALAPAVRDAKAAVLAIPSTGAPRTEGPPLRRAVARNVRAQARLSGRSAGARVRVSKKGLPRGFANAPKRLNRAKGWRHPVYGRDVWVHQVGKPGWFDDTLARRRREYRQAVVRVLEDTARRVTRRVH